MDVGLPECILIFGFSDAQCDNFAINVISYEYWFI